MKKIILIPFILALAACSSQQIKTGDATIQTPFVTPIASTPKIKQQLITLKEPESRFRSILALKDRLWPKAKDNKYSNNNPPEKKKSSLPRFAQYVKRGIASWYGPGFHGKKTASGEKFNMYEMTAAHKTLPIHSYAQVTNLKNNKSVVVRINDRGPYSHNRVLDLSYAAAKKIGIHSQGTGKVEIKAISPS